ncbi:hypothetical protein JX265_001161 [Neoarthrinium moseri]|uniref:Lysine-specific metallo-endopeptidase domain-containing protein n=1 Tax=Neoarthrinium moseri TaxID=1658444 RepID=A0A9P9WX94_9PEZI|nr:hypothetical protein JX265_001161 [Neoarthrinium moseri]
MKLVMGVCLLARLTNAASLNVTLQMIGNTGIKVMTTNNGGEDLKVLRTGTFLESTATEKVEVLQSGSRVPFDGIRLLVSTASLDEDAFQTIPVNEMIETEFDISHMHDLSAGGVFQVIANGALSYASAGSTAIAGIVPYTSNIISSHINGSQAQTARKAFLEKRTLLQSDCTGTNLTTLRTTIDNYPYPNCVPGVLAYAIPSQSYIAYCDLFFTLLPAVTQDCHAQDQAGTMVHEFTHLDQIKGANDYGSYGYKAVQALPADKNINHADTYALYAQAVMLDCD